MIEIFEETETEEFRILVGPPVVGEDILEAFEGTVCLDGGDGFPP